VICPDCHGEGGFLRNPTGLGHSRDPQFDDVLTCGRCQGDGEVESDEPAGDPVGDPWDVPRVER
jgi:DnaJ-class molecular chaperone